MASKLTNETPCVAVDPPPDAVIEGYDADEQACLQDSDCMDDQSCIDPGSKVETVWWDDRTDAAGTATGS